MKFSNGKKLTVMSLVFIALTLYIAFFGSGSLTLACTALILAELNLESDDG